MKKTLLFITLFTIASFSFAQFKTLDKGGKKGKWVNSVQKDFIIATGSGKSIEEAQNNALTFIKQRIVSSVADNIQVTSELNKVNTDDSYTETYKAKVTSQSADLPYIKGISLNKADKYYWEKLKNRKTKEISFNYHIKYPFSEFELKKIVLEFDIQDKKMNNQLTDLLGQVEVIDDVDKILNNIRELNTLAGYFIDQRKKQAELGIIKYKGILKSIIITNVESELGKLVFTLKLGDKEIETSRKPRVKSQCAKVTSTSKDGKYWTILYDTESCYEDPENALSVQYKFGTTKIKQAFYFNINEKKADVYIKDNINFSAINKDDKNITESKCEIDIISKFDTPIIIEKVVLNWKKLPPVIFTEINQEFNGKGNHSLILNCTNKLNKIKYSSNNEKGTSLVNGMIHYKNKKTGESLSYKIYNHNFTTDW